MKDHQKREMRLIEEILKKPVNGFILETCKERRRRKQEAQAKEGGAPGEPSIEPKPPATIVQTIIISDSDSEHRDPPMELSDKGGDDYEEWLDYEGGSSVQGGGDSEYIDSGAGGGGRAEGE